MTITHTLKMNMDEGTRLQRLEMPLGDAGSRQIELFLYANQRLWPIPDDATVVIRYKKPDGTVGEYDTLPDGKKAWMAYDNMLQVSLVPQMLTAEGIVTMYVCLYQEAQVAQTFAMEILVKAPIAGMRTVTSEDYAYLTNVLRGPVAAQKGQVLAVGSVDDMGRVTKVEAQDAETLVREQSSAVLYTAQNLTVNHKFQARTNIGAASQASVDFLVAKFAANGLRLSDEKTGEAYVLYVENGKLTLEKE